MLRYCKSFARTTFLIFAIFFILNTSHAAEIECLGAIGEGIEAFAIQDHYVYAAGGYMLHVIDINDPARPTEVGWVRAEYTINSVEVLGSTVYLGCDDDGGVQMVNVSNPAKPKIKKLDEEIGGNSRTEIERMGNFLIYQSSGSLMGTTWFELYDISGKPRRLMRGHYDDDVRSAYATDGKQIFCTAVAKEKDDRIISIEDRTSTPHRKIGTFNSAQGLEIEIGFHYDKKTGQLTFGEEGMKAALPIAKWPNAEQVWLSTEGETREPRPTTRPYGKSVISVEEQKLTIRDPKDGRVISQWGNRLSADLVKVVDRKAYMIGGERLSIIDCAKPGRPTVLSQVSVPEDARACAIENNALFISTKSGNLLTLNITAPTSPTLIGSSRLESDTFGLTASGDRLYAACHAGLFVYDIKDAAHPNVIGRYETENAAYDLATSGSLVYLLRADSLDVVDVKDPTKPQLKGKLALKTSSEEESETPCYCLKRLGNILYAVFSHQVSVEFDSELRIIDVTDPDNPALVREEIVACQGGMPKIKSDTGPVTKTMGWLLALPTGFHISNENGHYLIVYDLSDPKTPVPVGIYKSFHDPYTSAFLFKDRIYKPDGDNGLLILGRE